MLTDAVLTRPRDATYRSLFTFFNVQPVVSPFGGDVRARAGGGRLLIGESTDEA